MPYCERLSIPIRYAQHAVAKKCREVGEKMGYKIFWIVLVIAALICTNPVWGQENERININTASAKELAALQDVGPKYAVRIIEHRRKYGPFKLTEELMEIRGIGLHTYDRIKHQIVAQ